MKKQEVIRCQSCGSSSIENSGNGIGKCSHCGSTMILPRQNEEIISMLNAAYVYRENFNYDLAIKSYQFVLEKDSNELAAYEGILLSEYGIEYVKDSYTGRLVPTCHRAHFKSIFEDDYYKTLITLASDEQKVVIEQKAKEIDKLQQAIERQLKNEQEYDVFISYKANDEKGERTEDSLIARNIYEELVKKNYRVFFAEKSLEDRLGSEYEPIIFKALHTSKIFILVGTSKQNVEANWVRNEWSRFIDRIKTDKDLPVGCFIPVFKDMSPYDMPKVNNTFVQGVDAGKLGYVVSVVDGVTKLLKPEKEQKVISVFDDIDNFAEFDRIKRQRNAELKEKRWKELKASKGIKKWCYYAFLFSPWILGLATLILSFSPSSYLFQEMSVMTSRIVLWSILVVLAIVVTTIHIIKYGIKRLHFTIVPYAFILAIVLSSVSMMYLIPIAPGGFTMDNISMNRYYDDGLFYKWDGNDGAKLNDICLYGYKRYTKKINGKTVFYVPKEIAGNVVKTVEVILPKDIDIVVFPKGYEGAANLYVIGNKKLDGIYFHSAAINGIIVGKAGKDEYGNRWTASYEGTVNIYYENTCFTNSWGSEGIEYLPSYMNVIAGTGEMYK